MVDTADVVLEILDARDPLGSRCQALEAEVLSSGTTKKLVLVLNKIGIHRLLLVRESCLFAVYTQFFYLRIQ